MHTYCILKNCEQGWRIIKRSWMTLVTILYSIWMQFVQKDLRKIAHLNLTRSLNNLAQRERERGHDMKRILEVHGTYLGMIVIGRHSKNLQSSSLGRDKSPYFPQKPNRTRKVLTSFPIGTLLPNAVRSPILKVGKKMFLTIWLVEFSPDHTGATYCQNNNYFPKMDYKYPYHFGY